MVAEEVGRYEAPESKMGQVLNRCKVIRITKREYDQSTPEGKDKAMEIVRASPGALPWNVRGTLLLIWFG